MAAPHSGPTAPTSPSIRATLQQLLAESPGLSEREAARALDVSPATVHNLIRRYAPVGEAFKQLQRDALLGAWQLAALKVQDRLHDTLDAYRGPLFAKEIQQLAIAGGVATDKALLLAGQPTSIGLVLHEHRVQLPALLDRVQRLLAGSGQVAPTEAPAIETTAEPR